MILSCASIPHSAFRINNMDNLTKIAGVRFHDNWKVYDFDEAGIDVAVGDKVIVDSDRGLGVALVVRLRKLPVPPPAIASPKEGEEIELSIDGEEEIAPVEAPSSSPSPSLRGLRKILRKATEEDLQREEKNRVREAEAFSVAQAMIAERELQMKLIRAEYSFDASRATFFFFSETRVDFRDLVKDLAYKLKSRIEMRQIGVRDVARMIGGFGPCGRELCCSAFLKNFEPVSIRMAKKQDMVLNPAKISGVCGRLLCCLSYEFEMYEANKKDLASMREAAFKDKKEKQNDEEQRIIEERKEADERRTAEDTKRREDRKQPQEQRRDRQREGGQKSGRPEKKKDQQQEKKPQQPRPEQAGERQQARPEKRQPRPEQSRERQQPRPEKQQPRPEQAREGQPLKPEQQQPGDQEQKAQPPQQEGDASARKKKRRFWRRKKKGPQQGENKPQGPGTA